MTKLAARSVVRSITNWGAVRSKFRVSGASCDAGSGRVSGARYAEIDSLDESRSSFCESSSCDGRASWSAGVFVTEIGRI